MNLYVIQKVNGAYVRDMRHATLTNGASYTHDIRQAQLFNSAEDAHKFRCAGNESVVSLASILSLPR